jgi:hypothetical protein
MPAANMWRLPAAAQLLRLLLLAIGVPRPCSGHPPGQCRQPCGDPCLRLLSTVFGSHMVLQREPQQALVWGNTTAGATVTTLFNGLTLRAVADVNGTWRQKLPPMPASKRAFTLNVSTTASTETKHVHDLLFGDVFVCTGQSNMQYSMQAVTNASVERQLANDHPTIRLLTVAPVRQSPYPLREVLVTEQRWSVSSNTSIAFPTPGNPEFGYFSAVCYFFGRGVSEGLSPTGDVPIGLIDSSWGGTNIQCWSPFAAPTSVCGGCGGCGGCFRGMISPFTTGPLPVKGVTWCE